MDFNVHTEFITQGEDKIALVKPQGAIDQKSVPVLEHTIKEEIYRPSICYMVIDFSETKSINSTGLGLLINIIHQIDLAGGKICLINVAERFKVLFSAIGLDIRMPTYSNKEEAIASFQD